MDHTLTTTADEEEALVRQVARGDQDAFSTLYDRFAPVLLTVAMRVLNDAPAAEDVIQEVFVHIWERAADYDRARGKPLGWAVVMTRNRAIDRLRSRTRAHKLVERAAPELDVGPTVPANLGDADRAEHLRGALADLTTEQRTMIEMAFFGGLSQSEIAEKLSKPLGTVKAHIRRGMLKLRDRLQRFR
jgi:RNA polymerase sigma-70 factor (ECF subfamily)